MTALQIHLSKAGTGSSPPLSLFVGFVNEPVMLVPQIPPPSNAGLTWRVEHGSTQSTDARVDRVVLTSNRPMLLQALYAWSTADERYEGRIILLLLPEASKAAGSPVGRTVRHLLMLGPDTNFYLLSPNQTEWPATPFMTLEQSGDFKSLPGMQMLLYVPNGIIGALLKATFQAADGSSHAFYLLNLPSLLEILGKEHRGWAYRSLLLGGPLPRDSAQPQSGYLIRWEQGTGFSKDWPKTPTTLEQPYLLGDLPNKYWPSQKDGPLSERYIHAKIHDGDLGNVLLYNLGELLHFLNREDSSRVVTSLYQRDARSGDHHYQFFQIDQDGIQPMGDPILDEVHYYRGGRDRAGVMLTRLRKGGRDTYLYNINAYANSAEAWGPGEDTKNELLILAPTTSKSDAPFEPYYFIQIGDTAEGDIQANGDMRDNPLPPNSRLAQSVADAVEFGVVTGVILKKDLEKPSLADPTVSFISCYLLNLAGLLR